MITYIKTIQPRESCGSIYVLRCMMLHALAGRIKAKRDLAECTLQGRSKLPPQCDCFRKQEKRYALPYNMIDILDC